MKVIREMVNNAILHRDYDIEGASIQITIAKDAIIIKSPGNR
jgi:predicted HTH transcriptional regulator